MATPAVPTKIMTAAEYLESQRDSLVKREFAAGEVYAMTGATDRHNFISLNFAVLLRNHLRGTPCRVFMADIKVRVEAADAFYYPDVMVSCEAAPDRYFREQPVLIAEVLSDSTGRYARSGSLANAPAPLTSRASSASARTSRG